MKLLADVGLVGYPSVGKSSIISCVSSARPEIAEYHFTTITPVLGVVAVDEEKNFVMADIPGLIEGAADGAGLGHEFLRHIERTKVILHIVDASGIEGRDPVEDYHRINHELKRYSEKLARRPQILVANKIDLPGAEENLPRLEKLAADEHIPMLAVSAATQEGLRALVERTAEALDAYVEEPEREDGVKVYDASQEEDPERVEIKRADDGAFVVSGKALEKLVAMTNFANDEAIRRFQYIWRWSLSIKRNHLGGHILIRKSLTSKQKQFLRALGTELVPVVNIGKEGVTPTVVESAKDAITKRELIKVRVLQNSPEEPKDAIGRLTERVDADLVQVIGRNGLLFKRNFKKPQIEFPE